MEYPLQMQRILDKKVPGKYQVINAAVPGLSPPRIHRLYDNWLKEFDADIVIYYPSPSVYLMRNPPGADFVKRSEERASNKFGLRIMAKASIVLKRFLPAELQTAMKKVVIKREVSKHPKNWVFQSPPLGRADLFGRHLRELVHRVQESGTRVVLATHATAINNPISEEGLQLLIGWRKLYPHVAESAFLEMEQVGNRIIKQVAEETQSDLVDIDAVLPKTKDVFADHVHFTTAGAGVVAELMAGAVLEIPHSRAVK